MSRAEKTGLGIAVVGIGAAVVVGTLNLAGVQMSPALLWLMGGAGLVCMVGGAALAIAGWRARERQDPVGLLRDALQRGMVLRTTLHLEDQGHWEGDELVPPDPTPISEDHLYAWARETFDLLREHFPASADAFFGDDPSLGVEYLALAYLTEVKDRGREAYLERRLGMLRDTLRSAR